MISRPAFRRRVTPSLALVALAGAMTCAPPAGRAAADAFPDLAFPIFAWGPLPVAPLMPAEVEAAGIAMRTSPSLFAGRPVLGERTPRLVSPQALVALRPAEAGAVTDLRAVLRDVPLPRPRPPDLGPRLSALAPVDAPQPVPRPRAADATPESEARETPRMRWPRLAALPPSGGNVAPERPPDGMICPALFALGYAVASIEPAIDGPGACDAPNVVRLDGVMVANRRVAIEPPATLSCDVATEIARWIKEDLAPAAAAEGAPLISIRNAASYHCRTMNNLRRSPMSEHGRANALDISALTLADGRTFTVAGRTWPSRFATTMRETACNRFSTVLGPGSDGFHEDHVHVDLAQRRRSGVCRWRI